MIRDKGRRRLPPMSWRATQVAPYSLIGAGTSTATPSTSPTSLMSASTDGRVIGPISVCGRHRRGCAPTRFLATGTEAQPHSTSSSDATSPTVARTSMCPVCRRWLRRARWRSTGKQELPRDSPGSSWSVGRRTTGPQGWKDR